MGKKRGGKKGRRQNITPSVRTEPPAAPVVSPLVPPVAPSVAPAPSSFRAKLGHLADSNLTWGAFGMIIAGIGAYFGVAWLVLGGWFFLTVAICRTNFFETRTKRVQVVGNALISLSILATLIAVMVFIPREGQKPHDESATPPLAPAVRVKYSNTQTIELPNTQDSSYNDTLNLDNVATMIHVGEANINKVEMKLLASSPLTIDKPEVGKVYETEAGNFATSNPNVTGVRISGNGVHYLFNRLASPTHVIQVGDRKFSVTLQSVRDKSTKKNMLISYTFAIYEL